MDAIESIRPKHINDATDLLRDVQTVNQFLQGITSQERGMELTSNASQGLTIILEWQNEVIDKAIKLCRQMPEPENKKAA